MELITKDSMVPGAGQDYFRISTPMSDRIENVNLVLKFKLTGDADSRIRAAARIKVDDQGGLTMYDAGGRQSERIDLAAVQSMSIRHVTQARRAA